MHGAIYSLCSTSVPAFLSSCLCKLYVYAHGLNTIRQSMLMSE